MKQYLLKFLIVTTALYFIPQTKLSNKNILFISLISIIGFIFIDRLVISRYTENIEFFINLENVLLDDKKNPVLFDNFIIPAYRTSSNLWLNNVSVKNPKDGIYLVKEGDNIIKVKLFTNNNDVKEVVKIVEKPTFKITPYNVDPMGSSDVSDIRVVNNTSNGKFDYYFNNKKVFSTTELFQLEFIKDIGIILKITTDDNQLITISTEDYKYVPNVMPGEINKNNIFMFTKQNNYSKKYQYIKFTYIQELPGEPEWLIKMNNTLKTDKELTNKIAASVFFGYSGDNMLKLLFGSK